ncbi:MAG: Gfo/Idh/MocA family oxidoreductase [Thermoguttaceae bacterium]|jgi:predicted dehydrogenase
MRSPNRRAKGTTRREFLTRAAAAGAVLGTGLGVGRSVHAAGGDTIRLALIGCGGRGTGAAIEALSNKAGANVKLVTMADAFRDSLDRSLQAISGACKDQVDVPESRKFTGLDCHQFAIESGVDMVLLCTPPGFRPCQFAAAVKAGKNVFMEKPVATDSPGIRKILAVNEQAKKQGLLVAVGHHLRHEEKHREVVKRIHDGAIGRLKFMRAYFNSSGVWVRPRNPTQTEMQYQVRNWYYFTWLSGDHIVEQHVHDLDVCNWIKDDHPIEASGMGGRQVRKGKDVGEIFDHHAIEFTYADGVKLFSYCRHIPGCWEAFSEHAAGTAGRADIEGHGNSVLSIDGQPPLRWRRTADGHQLEHDDLFAALLAGKAYNEADSAAASSMTAILGRMAAYSGQIVKWDDALNSTLDLGPKSYAWDAEAPVKPDKDGFYACAIPGVTKAW